MAGAIPAWMVLAGAAALFASPAGAASFRSPVYKSKGEWGIEGKYFQLSDEESISMYGVQRRRFLTDHWYWGEAGYGALTGRRGGYFEGGGAVGYQRDLFHACMIETRLFSGAGGGGGVQEGGGWILRPTVGLGVAWNSRFQTLLESGYTRFLNGNIRGWTGGIAVNYVFWDLQ